ncbi:MAG: ABC transporter permease [Chitinispirillaceae bacterium]|nr:ABC transporter permease [Chitinispirillaceae bacterium]
MFELKTAWRFLIEGKFQTILILTGIALGIAVQIFLSSLISGLQIDLVDKTVGRSSHITAVIPDRNGLSIVDDSVPILTKVSGLAQSERPVRGWRPVVEQLKSSGLFTSVSAVVDGSAFIFKGDRSRSVLLRGVSIGDAAGIYKLEKNITKGTATVSSTNILIGQDLAEELGLSIGSTVRIATPSNGGDLFSVSGIFDLQNRTINESWIFMDLRKAQALFNYSDGVTSIELQIKNVFDAEVISTYCSNTFYQFKWISWQKSNASLLAALKSQSSSSSMIQVLVLIAVTMGITSVLAVSAIQKRRQIGILKAVGATRSMVSNVFLLMGAILGFTGAVIGCVAGYGIIAMFIYGTSIQTGVALFPISIDVKTYLISILIATVSGLLAAAIPARRSASMNPVEVIRG